MSNANSTPDPSPSPSLRRHYQGHRGSFSLSKTDLLLETHREREFSSRQKAVREFIEKTLDIQLPNDDLKESLQDGVLLCRLMNQLKPGSIRKISQKNSFEKRENISNFLRAARQFGLLNSDLFETIDLFEGKDMERVIATMLALARIVTGRYPSSPSSSAPSSPLSLSPLSSSSPPPPPPSSYTEIANDHNKENNTEKRIANDHNKETNTEKRIANDHNKETNTEKRIENDHNKENNTEKSHLDQNSTTAVPEVRSKSASRSRSRGTEIRDYRKSRRNSESSYASRALKRSGYFQDGIEHKNADFGREDIANGSRRETLKRVDSEVILDSPFDEIEKDAEQTDARSQVHLNNNVSSSKERRTIVVDESGQSSYNNDTILNSPFQSLRLGEGNSSAPELPSPLQTERTTVVDQDSNLTASVDFNDGESLQKRQSIRKAITMEQLYTKEEATEFSENPSSLPSKISEGSSPRTRKKHLRHKSETSEISMHRKNSGNGVGGVVGANGGDRLVYPEIRSRRESLYGLQDDNDRVRGGRFSVYSEVRDRPEGSEREKLRDPSSGTEYQLGNCIGRGQFGSVYRAFNMSTGQMVAVKRIKLEGKKPEEIQQLMNEVELLKSLSYHSVVKYEGLIKTDEYLNIILELAENGSLLNTLKAFGKFPENLVASYTVKILDGLVYLHGKQVVHRDLKAANILTTKNANVKLSDFGVSLNLMKNGDTDVAGTPYWMAPEVIELKGASTKSDIWSLGCTIIELLTGKPPYADLMSLPALYRIVEDEFPPLPDGISDPLSDFLIKCFQKAPEARPTAQELFKHPWILSNLEQRKLRMKDSIPQLPAVANSKTHKPSLPPTGPIILMPMFPHCWVDKSFSEAPECVNCHEVVNEGRICEECNMVYHRRCFVDIRYSCPRRIMCTPLMIEDGSPDYISPSSEPGSFTGRPVSVGPGIISGNAVLSSLSFTPPFSSINNPYSSHTKQKPQRYPTRQPTTPTSLAPSPSNRYPKKDNLFNSTSSDSFVDFSQSGSSSRVGSPIAESSWHVNNSVNGGGGRPFSISVDDGISSASTTLTNGTMAPMISPNNFNINDGRNNKKKWSWWRKKK